MIDQLSGPPLDRDPQLLRQMADLKQIKFLAEKYGYQLVPKARVVELSAIARVDVMTLYHARETIDVQKLHEEALSFELGKAIIAQPEFRLLDRTTDMHTGDWLLRLRVRLVSPKQE